MRAEQEEEQEPVKTITQTTYEALLERQSYFFHIDSANETEEDFLEDENKKEDAYIHDYARPRKYIIKQNSKFKFWFDMMIISLASFNVFTIPFIIAFDPPEASSWWYSTIVWLINIIFVIDIIINFRTTFINNRTGDEVWEPKMIAKRYLLGPRFWIDLLSALPLDQIITKGILRDSFSLLGMLKAVRVMRLSTVIQSLNIRQDYKAYLKLVKLVFYLTIYIHFIAWIFYYIVDAKKQWIPGLDFIYAETTIYSQSTTRRYLSVMYHAVMLIGLNEIYAHTTTELFVFSFLMLISSMVNANIFGVIAVLVSEANKGMNQFQERMDTSNTAMANLKVPPELQRKVKEFMLMTRSHQQRQEEMKEFLSHCSPSLMQKVYNHIFTEAAKRNDIIFDIIISKHDEADRIIFSFVRRLDLELAEPEQILIEQDTELDEDPNKNFLYLIASGEWAVIIKDKSKFEDAKIKVMLEGDHFGEVSLFYKCKRTATIMSNNYLTLGKMSEADFKDFLNRFDPQIEDKFREMIYTYDDPKTKFLLKSISKIEYFQGVSEKTKRDIVYSLNPINYEKGGILFKPEDVADCMYIVDSGVVEVYILMDKKEEFVIDRLHKGSIINHRAFLFNDEIDTYAKWATMVSMYYIKIEDLSQIRARDSFVDSKINEIEESMVYRDNAVAIDYIISNPKLYLKDKRPIKEIERVNGLTHILKNAVMFHIGKNREKRKKPNLSDILFAAVEKKKREMQAARKKKANFDSIDIKGNYLTDDEFEIVGELIQKQINSKMDTQLIETLQKKFEILLSDIERIQNPQVAQRQPRKSGLHIASALSITNSMVSSRKNIPEEEKSKEEASVSGFKPL